MFCFLEKYSAFPIFHSFRIIKTFLLDLSGYCPNLLKSTPNIFFLIKSSERDCVAPICSVTDRLIRTLSDIVTFAYANQNKKYKLYTDVFDIALGPCQPQHIYNDVECKVNDKSITFLSHKLIDMKKRI